MSSFYKNISITGIIASIVPTEQEYKEARENDFDPDTFDAATYKRLRNHFSHNQIIDAIGPRNDTQVRIPIEDLELAAKSNGGDYQKSLSDAIGYQQHYVDTIRTLRNSIYSGGGPDAISAARAGLLPMNRTNNVSRTFNSNDNVPGGTITDNLGTGNIEANILTRLFKHHATLKNLRADEDPERSRAHEWVLSEISKLVPQLREKIGTKKSNRSSIIPGPNIQEDFGTTLLKHYQSMLLLSAQHSPTIDGPYINDVSPERLTGYLITRRRHAAAFNIAANASHPHGYSEDVYEEGV